jgi:hypothetical protein
MIFTVLIIRSMASVTWFEIGSLFCGVAPSVKFLIFGRAVAGIGAAGSKFISDRTHFVYQPDSTIIVLVSVLSIIGEITRLEDRPKLFGYALGCFIHPFSSLTRSMHYWITGHSELFLVFRQSLDHSSAVCLLVSPQPVLTASFDKLIYCQSKDHVTWRW